LLFATEPLLLDAGKLLDVDELLEVIEEAFKLLPTAAALIWLQYSGQVDYNNSASKG